MIRETNRLEDGQLLDEPSTNPRRHEDIGNYISQQQAIQQGTTTIDVDGDGVPDIEARPLNNTGEEALENAAEGRRHINLGNLKEKPGFFQTILLMLIAGAILYYIGSAAWKSLLKIDVAKIQLDAKENFDILTGRDTVESENKVQELIDEYQSGQYIITEEVYYTYNKKKKTIIFEVEGVTLSYPTEMFPDMEFKSKDGIVEVEVYCNYEDGSFVSCSILSFK